MKKLYMIICALFSTISLYTSAQDIFIVEKHNGDKVEFNVKDIKEMRFKDQNSNTGNLAPEGVKMVDLGLSVAWASCNVGATKPEETGYFVKWGELEQSQRYSWSSYKFGTAQSLTKYTANDGQINLQTEDDLASQLWGTAWHTPTFEQCKELIENCTIDYYATENDVLGVRFTSKVEGYTDASIFFPATGYIQDAQILSPTDVYVWASTVAQGMYQFAQNIFACTSGDYEGKTMVTANYRCLGLNVRAVADIQRKPESVDLGLSVYWATCNIGAKSEEQSGIYVAWGETSGKETYSWSNYAHGTSSTNQTKYTRTDKLSSLEATDDAATAAKGEGWRMPTSEEVKELFANCDAKAITINGINCMQFTSRVSGHEGAQIAIPFGGYFNGENKTNENVSFYLWTSDLVTMGFRPSAYEYEGSSLSAPTVKSADRYTGRNIRAVKVK